MKPLIFRRNALIFCASASILLCGCEAPQSSADFVPQAACAYSVDASVEYGSGQTAVLKLTRYEAARWEADFTEPDSLAGVVLQFDGSTVSASYKGLAFSVPKSALPAKNMLMLATEALDTAAETQDLHCKSQDDGTYCWTGNSDAGSYTVTFAETGEPVAFEMPSQPCKITLTNFTVLTDQPAETTALTTAAEPSETTAA